MLTNKLMSTNPPSPRAHGRLTRERLGLDVDLQLEVSMILQIVGEAARRLREHGADLGEEIDLLAIAGMRNRISHDYEGVDWSVVEEAQHRSRTAWASNWPGDTLVRRNSWHVCQKFQLAIAPSVA